MSVEQDGRDRRRSGGRAGRVPERAGAAQATAGELDSLPPSDRDSGLNTVWSRNARRADISEVEGARGPAGKAPLLSDSGIAPALRGGAMSVAQRVLFHGLYREHFDFVYRNLRRLGVPTPQVEDALQDVYLVVLRHIDAYRPGTHARAWLFAIAMRVAGNYRRSQQRRGPVAALRDDEPDLGGQDSFDLAARAQARKIVHAFLDRLDDERRAVFVMAELEQMTAPEIALALSANLNTVYSRLRTARIAFDRMLSQLHSRNGGDHG